MASQGTTPRWAILEKINRRRSWRWARRSFTALVLVAVFANFLANNKPLICQYQGQWYAPAFRAVAVDLGLLSWPANMINLRWEQQQFAWVIWPPVPYAPNQKDIYNNSFTSPFGQQTVASLQFRHWLGTDNLGRDVLAGLIWGTRVALLIGLGSMLISTFIGLLLGSLAGYFGDRGLRLQRRQWLGALVGLAIGGYLGFVARQPLWDLDHQLRYVLGGLLLTAGFCLGGGWLARKIGPKKWGQATWSIPADTLVMRAIETINAIPALLLLLSIVAIVRQPSLLSIIIIIGLLRWTSIARFVRGELLRVRELEYIAAARVAGFAPLRILWHHALPNALGPVYVALAFGVSGAILIEAGLSFLGIGMPADLMTWGRLLSFSRQSPAAWWLAVFPGLAIFVTVTVLNILGEVVNED
ncbi:MAG: ABC transporter permease [Bacteroidetes bacterium]|nr:MAG: ABC transporter permease [Bacteroidota bacterium]PTM10186.1 MAG: ABC transporter permease [Bacteroidota bacterium]